MCSDSEKNMSAFADENHAPSFTCVRLGVTNICLKKCKYCKKNVYTILPTGKMMKCVHRNVAKRGCEKTRLSFFASPFLCVKFSSQVNFTTKIGPFA